MNTKKLLITLAPLAFLIFNYSCGQSTNTNSRNDSSLIVIEKVNAEKFKQLLESGDGILLDVRTPEEVNQGIISGASTINFYDDDFETRLKLVQHDKPVFVYCKAGGRSSEAAAIMKKNGFKKVYNLEGGLNAWMGKGFPVSKPEGVKDENIKQMTLNEFNEILKTKLPVLVDFHTLWCSPCRKMSPVVDKIANDFKGKALVLRLDVDKSREVAKQYGIQGVPVFILFKNGVEKWKQSGITSESTLTKIISENIK